MLKEEILESGDTLIVTEPDRLGRNKKATLLNYLNINIIDINKILGHAKSSTTMDIYAYSFEGQSWEAANRLDEFLENNQQTNHNNRGFE